MAVSKVSNMRQFLTTVDNVKKNKDPINQMLMIKQGEYQSGIVTDQEFKDLIRACELGLSDQALNDLTAFAMKGSEWNRPSSEDPKDAIKT